MASDAKILYSVNFWVVLVGSGGRVGSLTLHVHVHKSAHIILGVRLTQKLLDACTALYVFGEL